LICDRAAQNNQPAVSVFEMKAHPLASLERLPDGARVYRYLGLFCQTLARMRFRNEGNIILQSDSLVLWFSLITTPEGDLANAPVIVQKPYGREPPEPSAANPLPTI